MYRKKYELDVFTVCCSNCCLWHHHKKETKLTTFFQRNPFVFLCSYPKMFTVLCFKVVLVCNETKGHITLFTLPSRLTNLLLHLAVYINLLSIRDSPSNILLRTNCHRQVALGLWALVASLCRAPCGGGRMLFEFRWCPGVLLGGTCLVLDIWPWPKQWPGSCSYVWWRLRMWSRLKMFMTSF